MRAFHVLVFLPARCRWLQYNALDGPRALACMEKLASRGRAVRAVTEAHGIIENLTLAQMRESIITP